MVCSAVTSTLHSTCSAGVGQIDHRHLEKADGEIGMLVVKIGGPAYRIGMGGGAASSVPSGSNKADLDFNAVQVCLCVVLSGKRRRGCVLGWRVCVGVGCGVVGGGGRVQCVCLAGSKRGCS